MTLRLPPDIPPRRDWVAALSALEPEAVLAAADALVARYPMRPVGLPRAGLRLLTLKDSVSGEDFFLGEIPIATAAVVLSLPDGAEAPGGAEFLGDDEDLATALAVLDAALAAGLPGTEPAHDLLKQGDAVRRDREATRAAMLVRTRVDFSLMSEVGDA